MRRLTDTLPTLRDAAPEQSRNLPAALRIDRFDAPPAPKSFARPGTKPAAAPPDEFDVAALRASLLKRRPAPESSGTPQQRSAPFLTSRPTAAAIPPLDGPRVDVEGRIAEALAAARAEADRTKADAIEVARRLEREAGARTLAEARATWAREEAGALRAGLAEVAETLHLRLSDAFGRLIAPFATAAVRDVAVRRFAAVLDDLVGVAPTAPAIVVRGPADLVAACRAAIGDTAVRFEIAATADLAADVGDTRLETMLAAFAETLAATLAPPAAPPPSPAAPAAAPDAPAAGPVASAAVTEPVTDAPLQEG